MSTVSFGSGLSGLDGQKVAVLGGPQMRAKSRHEAFYAFMTENKDAAATALSEPGWNKLGPEHSRFYRRGELPGKQHPRLEGQIIGAEAMSQIMAGLGLLGAPID